MNLIAHDERCLTALDHARLRKLPGHTALAELLDAADVVPSPEVDPDVVTLYSMVLVSEEGHPEPRKLVLCLPQDAEPQNGYISVLSPVGTALLGRRVGARVEWTLPTGQTRRMTIDSLLFQPEASGDYQT